MESKYLGPNDEGAFVDYPERQLREGRVECPGCKGHGGWNLILNSYRLPVGMEDTPENRHKHVHFRACCQNCNGWGDVVPGSLDETCIHEYHFHRNEGRCLNSYKCSKCGKTVTYDSSD